VHRLSALGTEVSGEGRHVVNGIGVHEPTLAKPEAFGKDIGAGTVRVLATG